MKKFLLFAIASLISVTMSAQQSDKLQSKRTLPVATQVKANPNLAMDKVPVRLQHVNRNYGKQLQANDLKKVKKHSLNAAMKKNVQNAKFFSNKASKLQRNTARKFDVKSLANLTATKKVVKRAPRRAAALKDQYKGTGLDYEYDADTDTESETPVEWDMYTGIATYEDETEVPVLIDIVPEPAAFTTLYEEGIPVEYTVNDNKLVIEPQLIAGSVERSQYVFIFGNTDDATITLTVGEDGSLKTPSGLEIVVGVFSSSDFYSDAAQFLGYYQWTENVKYTFEGQQVAESPFNAAYPGSGFDYFNEVDLTWTMTPDADNSQFNSFVPAPEELAAYFPNGLNVPYTIEGNKVTIDPYYTGLYYDNGGTRYYLTLFGITETSAGSINLTLGEDKSLVFNEPTDVVLGAFAGTYFDETFEAYNGGYLYIENVSFTAAEPGKELNLEVTANFTGYGDKFNGQDAAATPITWPMKQGILTEGEQKLNVFVDLIPTPSTFASLYPSGIPVVYSQTGSTITIEPQVIAKNSSDQYVIIASGVSEDGAIILTVGANGELQTENGEEIFIGAWDTEEFDPTFETYKGYYSIVENVSYIKEGQVVVPEVEYEPVGLYLHAHYSPSFYGYSANYSIVPANGEVSFRNFTATPTETWSWNVIDANTEEVAAKGSDRDFSFNTVAGEVYIPAVLVGANGENVSEPYQWGLSGIDNQTGEPNYTEAYLFAGEVGGSFAMSDGTYSIISKANPDFQIAYYGFLGTPDVNTNNYSLSSLILYQGKPSVPLYIEGINYLVRDFVAKEGFELKCKIQKATRSDAGALTLGDVIAEADINPDDIYYGDDGIAQLNWNEFYVEDEWGMSVSLDHLFIEDEFVVVIEGWDNGTFTANPYGEYDYNVNGVTSTYITQTGDEYVYRFPSLYSHQLIGFNGAGYGYLLTDTNKVNIAAEGGEASINVKPMLYSITENEETTTRLWLEDDSEIPEWLKVGFANEQYGEEQDGTFDLVFKAEALPEGVEGRVAELTFYQEGAKLVVTVAQGDVDAAVNTVKATTKTNVKYYSLDGREMKQKKGIAVSNGKKFILR